MLEGVITNIIQMQRSTLISGNETVVMNLTFRSPTTLMDQAEDVHQDTGETCLRSATDVSSPGLLSVRRRDRDGEMLDWVRHNSLLK
jgi:hypothetical protein